MANAMQELMDMKIWFLWRKELDGNRINKIPFAAGGGATGTNEKYRHTWVSYNEALDSMKKQSAAGLGFVIPKGYFFLDIDHKSLTDPFVQNLLERFNSYTERSVSGNGIHIYGKCDFTKLPTYTDKNGNLKLDKAYYMKNPNNHLELYVGGLTNRFAAYTGDVILNEPLKESTEAVLLTLDKNMRKTEKAIYSKKRDVARATFDIVCNLRKQKNGDKFKKLYDDGDISGYMHHIPRLTQHFAP
jgi:putative DNA primase/helicase